MCSETSPRISFSTDLQDPLIQPEPRRDCNLLESNSNFDFEFSICSSSDNQSSSADELFADGIIVPALQFPKSNQLLQNISLPPLPSFNYEDSVRQDEILNAELEGKKKNRSKSLWGFKRSSSLNCDIKKTLICSLPLLSRSNSTGSVVKQKPWPAYKDLNKQKQQLGKKVSGSYVYSIPQKPPSKKHYANGVKMSSVLSVPPPYIGRGTATLFGLGSFSKHGKDKNRR